MQQVPLAYAPSPAPTPRAPRLDGSVSFASEEEQEQRSVELLGAGALLVRLPPPTTHVRGHLGGLLEELVERELARAGAPSPYLAAWTAMPDEANARLADQLLRAQAVGASGLAIALGTLAHIAEPSLSPDDSALLRWLAEATTALPLVLLIDDADMHLTGYAAPRPLVDLLVQHDDSPIVLSDATDVAAMPVAPSSRRFEGRSSWVEDADAAAREAAAAPPEPSSSHFIAYDCADASESDAEIPIVVSPEVAVANAMAASVAAFESALPKSAEPENADESALPMSAEAENADESTLPMSAEAEAATTRDGAEPVVSQPKNVLELDLAEAMAEADAARDADAPTRRLPRMASGAALLRAVMTPPAPTAHSAEQSPVENAEPVAAAPAEVDMSTNAEPAATAPDKVDMSTNETSGAQPSAERISREKRVGRPVAPAFETAPADHSADDAHDTTASPPRTAASRSAEPRRPRASRAATAGAIEATAANDAWRTWALTLTAARGAQPLAAFEKLFTDSYVPLAAAIAGGLDDPRAVRAFDEFRRSFERSYTDAFAAFGATNRRPRLVMDTFDLAIKNARLVGARSAHILLVDSMRFDLGAMVKSALGREAAGVASLQSETLLWAALPTTTMRQLETLARGMDAIRAPAAEEPSESLRGRAAEVVRRFRLGSREIYKLDLVPALLESAGANAMNELPNIAQSVAEAIARHVTTLAPRTLLFVVGDHGFSIDRRGQIQTGGASPEEVLVPAQAWLIGDLH